MSLCVVERTCGYEHVGVGLFSHSALAMYCVLIRIMVDILNSLLWVCVGGMERGRHVNDT
jgi:hypothetical protein